MKPFVDELHSLETDGIYISINRGVENFKAVISCITRDNLFLHSLLGFVESFSATHPCWHCICDRSNFHTRLEELPDEVRTPLMYDKALTVNCVQQIGIKDYCVLNQLANFHAAENYVQDLMHDFLGGICCYDLCLICKKLTES